MIFHAVLEAVGLVETVGLAGAGHQLALDDILQQHALAVLDREVGEPRADVGGGKIEIGLLDVDAVDARDDNVVGGGRQWHKADEGRDEQPG